MKRARMLYYDIETSPNLGYTWAKYEQNVIEFEREWDILSVAWQWEGDRAPQVKTRADFRDSTDRSITRHIWNLLDEAHVVVGHNLVDFDNKKCESRFAVWNLGSPSSWQNVDTLRQARSLFRFNGNTLDELAGYFGLGRKAKTGGFQLWREAAKGCRRALARMARYNLQDVRLLRRVYQRIRPHMKRHPNLALIEAGNKDGCTHCGSDNAIKWGFSYTARSASQRMLCKSCNSKFTIPLTAKLSGK
jgi:DNA polymerase III epsilon subunit-like protein